MLPRYRFVVILLLAVAAHAQDPCNPPTACRDVLTVNGSGNTAIVKTTDRIDRYTREYILLSPSADGPREFARITSGEGDGLQALYVDRQGFLLESQSKKASRPRIGGSTGPRHPSPNLPSPSGRPTFFTKVSNTAEKPTTSPPTDCEASSCTTLDPLVSP